MSAFSEKQATEFKEARSKEKYFSKFVWYNSYLHTEYKIPVKEFKNLDTPFWSRIRSIELIDDLYEIKVYTFPDHQITWEHVLESDLITFNKDRIL